MLLRDEGEWHWGDSLSGVAFSYEQHQAWTQVLQLLSSEPIGRWTPAPTV